MAASVSAGGQCEIKVDHHLIRLGHTLHVLLSLPKDAIANPSHSVGNHVVRIVPGGLHHGHPDLLHVLRHSLCLQLEAGFVQPGIRVRIGCIEQSAVGLQDSLLVDLAIDRLGKVFHRLNDHRLKVFAGGFDIHHRSFDLLHELAFFIPNSNHDFLHLRLFPFS